MTNDAGAPGLLDPPPRAQPPASADRFDPLDRPARGVVEAVSSQLAPSRDHRLLPYALLAFGSLAITLVTGEAALVAFGVPFAIALAVGLRRRGIAEVHARIELDSEEVLEGDTLAGHLSLSWDPALEAHVLLHRLKGVTLESPGSGAWAIPVGVGRLNVPLSLRATQWGRHSVVEVWVRLGSPLSFLSWTGRVLNGPTLRVLPASERLNRLLDPAQSRTVLGVHRSVRLGEGHDFAELRPYTPGDRLRDLNWRATARQRRPFVNQRHPELSGDVVIVLDAFADGSAGATQALTRAARAAWAIASVHLQANDRVGLASIGGGTHWLPPAGGRRAKYRLLQTLLSIGGDVADRTVVATPLRIAVPPSALVFALTPLQSPRFINALETWRARGRSVVAVVVDTRDLLAPPTSSAEAYARRLWSIEIDGRMHALADIGIPVVTLHEDGTIGQIVSALRRARRAPTVRRRYA